MKKRMTAIALLLLTTGILSGCGHQHVWKAATCTEPKICTECGETEGTLAEHTWTDATCSAPKTCSVCGKTEGSALEHTWMEATCTTPKTCSVCRETEGEVAEHDLDSTGKCLVCDKQIGFALNMSNYTNYLKLSYDHKSFEFYNSTDPNRSVQHGTKMILEPIANVTFVDVTVTFENVGTLYNENYGPFDVSSTGYAKHSFFSNNVQLKSISGYVIE